MRICFVCVGNICRSPAAEALLVHLAAERCVDGVIVDSAGTSDYHAGEAPHASTLAEARRRGVPIDHRSRPVGADDFDRFDLLVAVDRATHRAVQRLAPSDAARAQVVLVGAYASDAATVGARDVADPWGHPPAAYGIMWDQLADACAGLLDHVLATRDTLHP